MEAYCSHHLPHLSLGNFYHLMVLYYNLCFTVRIHSVSAGCYLICRRSCNVLFSSCMKQIIGICSTYRCGYPWLIQTVAFISYAVLYVTFPPIVLLQFMASVRSYILCICLTGVNEIVHSFLINQGHQRNANKTHMEMVWQDFLLV